MTQFDIVVDELVVKRGPRKTGPLPAKYRDPESGASGSHGGAPVPDNPRKHRAST